MSKKQKSLKIGSVNLRKKKNESDKNSYYLKLDDNYSIVDKDGNVLETKFINLENPVARRERILASGKFKGDREKLEQEIKNYSSGGKQDFVTFEALATVES